MAISKRSTPSNRQSQKKNPRLKAGMDHVYITCDDPEMHQLVRTPLAVKIEFSWEMDGGSEFLRATFTGPELLKIAAEQGKLRETTSGERRVPQGIDAAARVISGGAA